jgi:hypothetical protein
MESDADGKLLKMGKKEDAFSFSLGPLGKSVTFYISHA